ncbi:Nn.00g079200.m01.CDS01 [Neocucurbitaria sp. VM-36]
MSEAEDAPEMAQPAPNPDAQTTVNDFLDYTEFFPSDLVRSLTLIGDLDSTYHDAVQQVHELTALYGKLPTISENERPDPTLLRKQISQQLQKAINQREFAFAEASRLYEVTVRHCQRSSVIKRKLQAQPQPPSRDPTPPPVSPQAQRSTNRDYIRAPHLRLTFDAGRHGANTSRPRDRHKKTNVPLPRGRSRAHSASSDSSGADSDIRSGIDVVISPRKHKQRDRHSKPGRSRPPGVLGTNVHSSIAGISTSNALAQLAPPPPDAKPGSKWAPWMKLTEYEMAVLRKQMKKNAVWTPSLTMVNRELERKQRTRDDYEREKARCEDAGEEILDEEPETLQQIMTASGLGQLAPHGPAADDREAPAAGDAVKDGAREEPGAVSIRLKPIEAKEGRKLDRLSQRQQAMRDAQELVDATEKIKEAANGLKELTFATPTSQKKRPTTRPSNKRKRETSPSFGNEGTDATREASVATQDSATRPPEAKRARLQLIAPAPNAITSPTPTPASTVSTPRDFPTSLVPSPVANTPIPLPPANGNTVQVPLAPAGPSTPKANKSTSKQPSRQPTPGLPSPTEPKKSPAIPSAAPNPTSSQLTVTAASSRPRRESVVPKATSPPAGPTQPLKTSKTATPAPEPIPVVPIPATRPRSARGHVPTPKAQSEEPKPNEGGRASRETRRHSIFSQSALTAPGPTRMSSRRKPPPKGEVTAAEDGQKTVTNVKRAQGSKNKKKKKAEEEAEQVDDIDPDEEKYCICDDVSYGPMISCDNNCDKEWFHLPCVNMTEADIPSRRAKWYCPDCRASLNTDAYGNPLVPPPLPGRRGNSLLLFTIRAHHLYSLKFALAQDTNLAPAAGDLQARCLTALLVKISEYEGRGHFTTPTFVSINLSGYNTSIVRSESSLCRSAQRGATFSIAMPIYATFVLGSKETYFFNTPTHWAWHNLPPDIEALFTKTPAIKDVIELAIGAHETYFISYRDHDGKIRCKHYNLPNPLTEYLYASHPSVIRDLTTLSITLGPYDSYYAWDKDSASWSNLPPSLEKAVLARLENSDAWKTTWQANGAEAPSFVSLGADGAYFMRTVSGGGCWDLKCGKQGDGREGTEGIRGTHKFLEECSDFSGIAGLHLFPSHPNAYILILTSGKAFSNLPDFTWVDYNKMAPALPTFVQSMQPIPPKPEQRPPPQPQVAPQPQMMPQVQRQVYIQQPQQPMMQMQQVMQQQPYVQHYARPQHNCCPAGVPGTPHNCCPQAPMQPRVFGMARVYGAPVAPQPMGYGGGGAQPGGYVYR